MISVQLIKEDIVNTTLEFIKSYDFAVPHKQIVGSGINKIRVFYKTDYFDENSIYYKKGIGDVLVYFNSGYTIVIKETVSKSWCFALSDSPHRVEEEVWQLTDKQEAIIPELRKALEAGFPHRNRHANLTIQF